MRKKSNLHTTKKQLATSESTLTLAEKVKELKQNSFLNRKLFQKITHLCSSLELFDSFFFCYIYHEGRVTAHHYFRLVSTLLDPVCILPIARSASI